MKHLFLLLLFLTGCAKFHDQVVVVVPKDFTGIVTLRIVQDTLHDGPPRRILHYYRPGYLDTVHAHLWGSTAVATFDGNKLIYIRTLHLYGQELDKMDTFPKGIYNYSQITTDGIYKESFRKLQPGDQLTKILIVDSLVNYKLRLWELDSTRKQLIKNKYGHVYY